MVEPPYVVARKAARKTRMSYVRWTPVKTQSNTAGAQKPPNLVLGTNAVAEPSNFPFPPLPVVDAVAMPGAMEVEQASSREAPITETTLVAHLAAMERCLGTKMDRTKVKVDKNSTDIRELRERVDKNDSAVEATTFGTPSR